MSREEFESLQKELNYWQNTTINILQKCLIDNDSKLACSSTIMTHHIIISMYIVYTCATKKLQATALKSKKSTSRRKLKTWIKRLRDCSTRLKVQYPKLAMHLHVLLMHMCLYACIYTQIFRISLSRYQT